MKPTHLILSLSVLLFGSCTTKPQADLLLYNAVVYAVDDAFSVHDAIAVSDGRVVGVGTKAELEAELEMLCQKVSSRMKAQYLAGGRVTLKLKRPDHSLLTRSQTLAERTDKAHVLFAVGRELLAREIGSRKRYRLLGIGADQLGPPQGAGLLDLVDERERRRDDLEAAIDDLHSRLGRDLLQSGRMFTRKDRPETDPERQRPSVEGADPDDDQSGSPT